MGLALGQGKETDPAPVVVQLDDTLLLHVAAGVGSRGYWDIDAQLHSGPPGLRGIVYSEGDKELEQLGRWRNMLVNQ